VVVNQANGQIICTAFGKGKEHDFLLFGISVAMEPFFALRL